MAKWISVVVGVTIAGAIAVVVLSHTDGSNSNPAAPPATTTTTLPSGGNGIIIGQKSDLYQAPSLNGEIEYGLENGTTILINCTTHGQVVTDNGRSSSLWDYISGIGGGYVPDVDVKTETGNQTKPITRCAGRAPTGAPPKATAGIGSAITLTGHGSGEQMAVTVTKVITDAKPIDVFNRAPTGDRLFAVHFRLRDIGSAAYSDSPSNGAEVVDPAGRSYQAGVELVARCISFAAATNIAPGASSLGCIVFEVPKSVKIIQVTFTLDSGFGPQTGRWGVGRQK